MTIANLHGVQVVHWNPVVSGSPRALRALGIGRRIGNFGDVLGPLLVSRIVKGGPRHFATGLFNQRPRLLTIGSIMHMAQTGDVVWGCGVNGKVSPSAYHFDRIDVRAVRGPRTRDWLLSRGIEAPNVFGDPALLLPRVFPELVTLAEEKRFNLALVPNFHDFERFRTCPDVVNPRGDVFAVLERILRSELVVASSLHGLIVAEAFGIPAIPLRSEIEPAFKYLDYYEGTGRREVPFSSSLSEALSMAPRKALSQDALNAWSAELLIKSFPWELW